MLVHLMDRGKIMSFKYKKLCDIEFGNEINSILKAKGIKDINSFLNPNEKHLENEFLLENIEKARDRLLLYLDNDEKIVIIVDSDVDGFTSAAMLYQYIKRLKPYVKLEFMLHDGKQHGLNDLLPKLIGSDYKLILVPDAGSNDYVECTELCVDGKDVIILDHHLVTPITKVVPLKYAEGWCATANPAIIVNNQISDKVKDKGMTGVGVVYKFCKVLDKYFNVNYADDYLDLLAVGMIADRCDMFNLQSRYLIFEGIKQISTFTNKNKFIKLLVENCMYSMNNKVTVNGLGYYVIPLMNSMIRLGDYIEKAIMFEALCNSDKKLIRKVRGKGEIELSIQEYALKSCQSTNRQQKKITEENATKLSEDIEKYGLDKYSIIVCNAGEEVEHEFTGLIANKLASLYQRPCLLMRRKNDICSGSGRGYDKSEIQDFNKWCKDSGLFEYIEGHSNAFGCSIKFNNTYRLLELISKMPPITEPVYYIYGIYNDKTLNADVVKRIAKYDYLWGANVDEPLFLIDNIIVSKYDVNLCGSRQNRLEFMYRNIKFIMFSRAGSLSELYKNIVSTGDVIKFTLLGKFSVDNKMAQVVVEDIMYEKSDKVLGFGF